MAGEIFISYRRTRRLQAERLEGELRRRGFADYQIFRDERGLFGGDAFDRQLEDTLRRTRLVLLLMGEGDAPGRRDDDWVSRELRAALAAGRPVLPVALGDNASAAARGDWPDDLRPILETQFLTLSEEPTDDQIARLVGAIRRFGIRPKRLVAEWDSLLRDNPVEDKIAELATIVATPDRCVALLEGRSGSGRTHVLREVARRVREAGQAHVAFHSGLKSRAVGRAGAVMYDWLDDLLVARDHVPDAVLALARCGFDPLRLDRRLVDRLSAAQRGLLRSIDPGQRTLGLATAAADAIERLADDGGRPLLLMIDDLDLADSSSQEIVRLLARRRSRGSSAHINLVLSAASSSLLTLFLSDVEISPLTMEPSVRSMLERAGRFDPACIDRLVELDLSPAECALYVRHLDERGLLVQDPGASDTGASDTGAGGIGGSRLWRLAGDRPLPSLPDILDDELDNLMPPSFQQVLETGALCGTRFDVTVADRVAAGGEDGTPLCQRLVDYDPDHTIVQSTAGLGASRLSFTSSMWWRHLRSRRVSPDETPLDRSEIARLAAALTEAGRHGAGSYDDWATIGFLYDSIDDNASAGGAFLHAARAARLRGADEASARGFREASRRLELHATGLRAGPERAGELFRAAYCRFRGATIERGASAAAEQAMPLALATRVATVRSWPLFAELDEVDQLLDAVEVDVGGVSDATTVAEFDDLVTAGADLNAEVAERLRMQQRTLRGFVELTRGRALLSAGCNGDACGHLERALMLGEGGLGGSVFHELVMGASAGLALAISTDRARLEQPEQFRTWFEHASYAAMLIARSPFASVATPGERSVFDDAQVWLTEARQRVAAGRPGPNDDTPSYPPTDEHAVVALVRHLQSSGAPPGRRRHPAQAEALAHRLLDEAPDLSFVQSSVSFRTDLSIYAWAHDVFRSTDPARLMRMWRDLSSDSPSAGRDDGAETEWHNPVLLHGKLAALWLELDLGVSSIVGPVRSARLRRAMESHTVGLADLPDAFDADTAFVVTAQLGDMLSTHPGDHAVQDCVERALRHNGLRDAYLDAHAIRARRLAEEGRSISPITERLVRLAPSSNGDRLLAAGAP